MLCLLGFFIAKLKDLRLATVALRACVPVNIDSDAAGAC